MMLRWIAQVSERALADEVAQHLLISRQRPPTERQMPQGHSDSDDANAAGHPAASQVVARALAIMQETIEEPLPCRVIAARLHLSLRQLQRYFQRDLGLTVTRQYLLLRLAKAHKLLQQTDLSVTEVAVGSGFVSLEHFSRVYRQAFGVSPSGDRRQSTSAPVLRQKGARMG
jgi:AraC family carnitine catabolism transcriptional activator